MNGIQMLLKSMGVNPDEITKSVSDFGNALLIMKDQMTRIEAKLDIVIAALPSDLFADEVEDETLIINHERKAS